LTLLIVRRIDLFDREVDARLRVDGVNLREADPRIHVGDFVHDVGRRVLNNVRVGERVLRSHRRLRPAHAREEEEEEEKEDHSHEHHEHAETEFALHR
jgi:hypothetical protein